MTSRDLALSDDFEPSSRLIEDVRTMDLLSGPPLVAEFAKESPDGTRTQARAYTDGAAGEIARGF